MTRGRLAASIAAGAVVGAAIVVGAIVGPWRSRDQEGPGAASDRAAVRDFWRTYREATKRRAAGDCRGAVESYRAALALRPGHEDSLYYLANCLSELGEKTEALRTYRHLAVTNPEGSSRVYMRSALLLTSLEPGVSRDLEEAERLFRRALDLDPDSGAQLGLAEVALLRGRPHDARTWLERAGAENSMSVAIPYLLGYLAWREAAREAAWRHFATAVERCKAAKPPVAWSEEGDVKADPALRWRALASQSIFGTQWLRLRQYVGRPSLGPADMDDEYRLLDAVVRSGAAE